MSSPRPETIHRAHGKPMGCPVCGNDVWADAPHVCPEGYVMPAPAGTTLTFYAYNSTNQCCRDWMLLGWPEIDGRPKLDGAGSLGMVHFDCPKCAKALWFDIIHPDAAIVWDVRAQGKPDPPALVAGRIRV
jgi:hypothetical protein